MTLGHNGVNYTSWHLVDQDCEMCDSVRREGWWGMNGLTHCRMCHRTWKMTTKQAHCTVCCAHFSSPSAFDLHLGPIGQPVACLDPGTLVNSKTGAFLLLQREDGTWARPDRRWPEYYDQPLHESEEADAEE